MASQTMKNPAGADAGSVELADEIFGVEPNGAVMHQVVTAQLAARRAGTQSTKTRGDVSGGGAKPWRQKGTGRARQGSTRAPNWIGGGVVWGPHMRDFSQDMPKKMRGLAVRSALSAKVRDERLFVVDGLENVEAKTRAMKDVIAAMPASRSYLLVIPDKLESVVRSSGNLENVHWVLASYLNVRDILKYERLVVMRPSIEIIEKIWALPAEKREPSVWSQARQAVRQQAQEASRG
jgi:large subunit ribosomal protein L4